MASKQTPAKKPGPMVVTEDVQSGDVVHRDLGRRHHYFPAYNRSIEADTREEALDALQTELEETKLIEED